jgi:hypothetical protein
MDKRVADVFAQFGRRQHPVDTELVRELASIALQLEHSARDTMNPEQAATWRAKAERLWKRIDEEFEL